jgi:hypothetical protein
MRAKANPNRSNNSREEVIKPLSLANFTLEFSLLGVLSDAIF